MVIEADNGPMPPRALDGDGNAIRPQMGVVPLLLDVGERQLRIVGTGFYITRYGLVATARHVVDDFISQRDAQGGVLDRSYVLHRHGENGLLLRPIRRFILSTRFDIAVVVSENYRHRYPQNPLMNMRGRISTVVPPVGERLVTYGYPENETLDFSEATAERRIFADYYEGQLLEVVDRGPWMEYSHYRTSIAMPHGTSGGPVFHNGQIVGINCRAWDFDGGEHQGQPLSSVVPIHHAFELEVGVSNIPLGSYDLEQIPADRRVASLTFGELVAYGLVDSGGRS